MGVKVFKGVDNLTGIALDFYLVEPLSSSKKLIHALVVTELKEDVDILLVFEEVLELYNVLVLDRSVDLDLTHELLLCSTLCQRCLNNHLCSADYAVFLVGEFIAPGKTSFAQELALEILPHLHFTIVLAKFLLDYRGDCVCLLLLGIHLNRCHGI